MVFTQGLYLLAISAALKDYFGGIKRRINAPEKHIILQDSCQGGMTVCCRHLVKYIA
jgi:hypothetical protein